MSAGLTRSTLADCHGALARAGIKRPKVTITADDPRLTAGKPDPAPFILAAKELGIPIEKCLVFEDSPSGIKAGVASGARTIAICTSHPVEKINTQGAHYIGESPAAFQRPGPYPDRFLTGPQFRVSTAFTRARTRTARSASPLMVCLLAPGPVRPSARELTCFRPAAHPPDHPRHGSRGSFVSVAPNWREIQNEQRAKKLAAINAAGDKGNSSMLGGSAKAQAKSEAAQQQASA